MGCAMLYLALLAGCTPKLSESAACDLATKAATEKMHWTPSTCSGFRSDDGAGTAELSLAITAPMENNVPVHLQRFDQGWQVVRMNNTPVQ
jgi:hypothetical protein